MWINRIPASTRRILLALFDIGSIGLSLYFAFYARL